MALSLLISREHEISGRIYQDVVATPVYINNTLEKRILRKLNNRFMIFKGLKSKFGKKIDQSLSDYVVNNPAVSAQNLIKHKHQFPVLHELYEQMKNCDAVIFNGEGDMIFTTPPRRKFLFQLMIIELAVNHFQKPVYYVNAMASDCPNTGRNTETLGYAVKLLEKCKFVSMRDPDSYSFLKAVSSDMAIEFIPDALFTLAPKFENIEHNLPKDGSFLLPFRETFDEMIGKYDFSVPYICIGGSSSAAHKSSDNIQAYVRLVNAVKEIGLPVFVVITCVGDNFLKKVAEITNTPFIPLTTPILSGGAILANAVTFVSGRFHPSIFASLGGTPCVFLGSNSHKTKSLQSVLEYNDIKEFSDLPNETECKEITARVRQNIEQGQALRIKIKETVRKRSADAEALLNRLN